jgi:hypothetical protein
MLDGSTDPSALCALIERPVGVNAGAIHVFTLARKLHEQQVGSLVPWRAVIGI